ncbi:zincin-like metallopeptidase domain-containing protein [Pantoea agglomerans]|uniref:zincin-like metallopeptidase domain-containing protein n=1 Tax=Enterobacter agglomerans TaxID=549 RepID=UPI003C7E1938
MGFKKYTKEQAAKAKEQKKEQLSDFTQQRVKFLIESTPEGLPLWESPILNSKASNPVSHTTYSPSNTVLLASQIFNRAITEDQDSKNEFKGLPVFLTYLQAQKEGLVVEAGTKSYQIVKSFVKEYSFNKKELNTDTGQFEDKEHTGFRHGQTVDNVFMLHDLKGTPSESFRRRIELSQQRTPDTQIEPLIAALEASSPVKVIRSGSFTTKSGSFYSPSHDAVNIPPSQLFKSAVEELSTLAHEIAHSWGHPDRLNRLSLRDYSKDDRIRAEEELVANIAAQAVLNHFNIARDTQDSIESFCRNHDTYDLGWASVIKTDLDAIDRAMQAVDKTASKIIFLMEKQLVNDYQANPDLDVSDYLKERLKLKEIDSFPNTENTNKINKTKPN